MMKIFFFLLFFKFTKEEKIIFAWQMNRHGARAPESDNIDMLNEYWDISGRLTSVGKRMLYLLGAKMRKRYKDFLSIYNPQEIYIKSTDYDRTIESIQSYLQGFFPEKTGPKIKNNIISDNRVFPPNKLYFGKFKEIINKMQLNDNYYALPNQMSIEPIHVLNPYTFSAKVSSNCISGRQKKSEYPKEFSDIKQKFEKYENIFPELKNISNNDTSTIASYLYSYLDSIICDYADSRNIGGKYGLNKEQVEELKNLAYSFNALKYTSDEYYEMRRDISMAFGSAEMDIIINYMKDAKEKYEKRENYTKFLIYSGHDTTIGYMDKFMKYIFDINPRYPTFASSRHLELYKDDNNEYRVRYISGNEEKFFDNLPYKKFIEELNEKMWNKKKICEFCEFEYEEPKTDSVTEQVTGQVSNSKEGVKVLEITWIIILAIDIILIIMLVIVFFKYYR